MVTIVVFVKATLTSNELSTKKAFGDMYCFKKTCEGEKCKLLDAHATTPRSIYGCRKSGARLLVHKAPIAVVERVKTTKIDDTRFLFAKRGDPVTWQANFHFFPTQQTNYSKKEISNLYIDNKIQKFIGEV